MKKISLCLLAIFSLAHANNYGQINNFSSKNMYVYQLDILPAGNVYFQSISEPNDSCELGPANSDNYPSCELKAQSAYAVTWTTSDYGSQDCLGFLYTESNPVQYLKSNSTASALPTGFTLFEGGNLLTQDCLGGTTLADLLNSHGQDVDYNNGRFVKYNTSLNNHHGVDISSAETIDFYDN